MFKQVPDKGFWRSRVNQSKIDFGVVQKGKQPTVIWTLEIQIGLMNQNTKNFTRQATTVLQKVSEIQKLSTLVNLKNLKSNFYSEEFSNFITNCEQNDDWKVFVKKIEKQEDKTPEIAEEGEIETTSNNQIQETEKVAKMVYKEVENTETLKEILMDTNVIEFPTLYV